MKPIVFLGPSLSRQEALDIVDCEVLPPAAAGDVIRCVLQGARTLVLIDGLYESVAPVRHKELLLALARGVRVVGAASMGALRAAELDLFGMEGVGQVYQWYRLGHLEDDDEVAVRHAPADAGFRPLCEALVNIRWVIDRAERQSLIASDAGRRLVDFAKSLYYPERTWSALRAAAPRLDVPASLVDTLAGLADQYNLKRDDARAALEWVKRPARAAAPAFVFEDTLNLRGDVERIAADLARAADDAHGDGGAYLHDGGRHSS